MDAIKPPSVQTATVAHGLLKLCRDMWDAFPTEPTSAYIIRLLDRILEHLPSIHCTQLAAEFPSARLSFQPHVGLKWMTVETAVKSMAYCQSNNVTNDTRQLVRNLIH
jgi:hypothetical protein